MTGGIDWTVLAAGPQALRLEDGRQLRLLSAREVLEARREGDGLTKTPEERPLCANACLVARALLDPQGQTVFSSGAAVLETLTPREIGALARRWAQFDRAENPGLSCGEEEMERLKKVWSTRRRTGCAGACSVPSACCPPSGGRGQ